MDYSIIKYPRTPHMEGSRLQPGDEDLSQVPFRYLFGRNIVIEEKIDGANCAVSFDGNGKLLLQSRGHYLDGGYREMEFDIYDREKKVFLDTPSRRELTDRIGIISSVPVIGQGLYTKKEDILSLIGHSNYITDDHIEVLRSVAKKYKLDPDQQVMETDPSTTMEGLYIKLEEDGIVKERFKYVRLSFIQCIKESNSPWLSRPILPNQLKESKYYV